PECSFEHFLIDLAVGRCSFGQRNRRNLTSLQRGHPAKLGTVDHVDCAQAIARRENAVKCGRGSSALNVSEHHRSRFKASPLFNFTCESSADASQPSMAEIIF